MVKGKERAHGKCPIKLFSFLKSYKKLAEKKDTLETFSHSKEYLGFNDQSALNFTCWTIMKFTCYKYYGIMNIFLPLLY